MSNNYNAGQWFGSNYRTILSNVYDYYQDVNAFYLQIGNQSGKLSYQAGIRYEDTDFFANLINTNEILASMLISLHNVNFYQEFMKKIRESIKTGTFEAFYKKNINKYN